VRMSGWLITPPICAPCERGGEAGAAAVSFGQRSFKKNERSAYLLQKKMAEEEAVRRMMETGSNVLLVGVGSKTEVLHRVGAALRRIGVLCLLVDGTQPRKRRTAERDLLECLSNLLVECRLAEPTDVYRDPATTWAVLETVFGGAAQSPAAKPRCGSAVRVAVLVCGLDGVLAAHDPSLVEAVSRLAALQLVRVAATADGMFAGAGWTPLQRRRFAFVPVVVSTWQPAAQRGEQCRPAAADILHRRRTAGSAIANAAADRASLAQLTIQQRALLDLIAAHFDSAAAGVAAQQTSKRRRSGATVAIGMVQIERLAKEAMLLNSRARIEETAAELCRARFLVQSESESGGRSWTLSSLAQRALALAEADEAAAYASDNGEREGGGIVEAQPN